MLIYLDESYDLRARYLCLGALYLPDNGPSNRQLEAIKDKYRRLTPSHSFSDVKYSKSGENFTFAVCREIIDLFTDQPAWFRAMVLDTALPGFSWGIFGGRGTRRNVTKARAYSRMTGLLLQRNMEGVADAVLLADSVTPMTGDDFVPYLSGLFSTEPNLAAPSSVAPRIGNIQRVDTGLPEHQLGQMCDVLLGVITGDLAPPTNRNKKALIQYAKEALGIPSFGPDYWLSAPERQPGAPIPKFDIWHWRVE